MAKIKVVYKKLGRHKVKQGLVLGFAHIGDNLVEIEARLDPEEMFITLVHELAHLAFPDASEKQILKAEKIIGRTLWEQGYRKVNQ